MKAFTDILFLQKCVQTMRREYSRIASARSGEDSTQKDEFVQLLIEVVAQPDQQVNYAIDSINNLKFEMCLIRFLCEGVPPNCRCEDKYVLDEVHWYCRPWYLEPTTHRPINYTIPVYTPYCAAFQDGIYPNCHWRFDL